MRLVFYIYNYASIGCTIKATQVLEYSYGEFLLRKRNGPECRYLYALENSAYHDVERIIKEKFVADGFEMADLLQIAFGPAACDVDTDGKPFEMNLWPYCANCGAEEPSSWQLTEPPEFVDIEIALTEHKLWNSLNSDQREKRVLACLRSFGFEPTL